MARKHTPPPESPQDHGTTDLGCSLAILLPFAMLALAVDWLMKKSLRFLAPALQPKVTEARLGCAAMTILLPAMFVATLLHWLYGKALLLLAFLAYRPRGIRAVFITSDSPVWGEYLDNKWLRPCAGRFVVLNWSQNRRWRFGLAPRLFRHFLGEHRNFCPAVIFLRGLHRPLLFRFFYAFRDHKHGDDHALNTLESRLEQELERVY